MKKKNYYWDCLSDENRIDELFSVEGKVVLITGAGGMGEMYAHGFARNGSQVILATKTFPKAERIASEITQKGYSCTPYQVDISSNDSVKKLISEIISRFGRIDILLNTSASCILHRPLENKDEDFHKNMDVNLYGAYYLSRAVGKQMKKQKSGSIIHVNTVSAFSVNSPDGTSYSISKSALMMMTKWFAVELAPYNVNVNGIAPIWMATPMMERRPKSYMDNAKAQVPMGRIAYTTDYLGLAIYMGSNAGRFMTGQTIMVDGGWSICRAFKFDPDN